MTEQQSVFDNAQQQQQHQQPAVNYGQPSAVDLSASLQPQYASTAGFDMGQPKQASQQPQYPPLNQPNQPQPPQQNIPQYQPQQQSAGNPFVDMAPKQQNVTEKGLEPMSEITWHTDQFSMPLYYHDVIVNPLQHLLVLAADTRYHKKLPEPSVTGEDSVHRFTVPAYNDGKTVLFCRYAGMKFDHNGFEYTVILIVDQQDLQQ